jgi:hypothetical protein
MFCFMLVGFALMERRKYGRLVWGRNLLVMWLWCLFFMTPCGIKILIGGQDCWDEKLLLFEGWQLC